MNIAFLGPLHSIHMQRIVRWFEEQGHEITILTYKSMLPNSKMDYYQDKRIHLIDTKKLPLLPSQSQWRPGSKVREIIKKSGADVAFGMHLVYFGALTGKSGARVRLLHSWGVDVDISIPRSKRKYIKEAMDSCDFIWAETHVKTKYIEKHWEPKCEILTVPLGVELKLFKRLEKNLSGFGIDRAGGPYILAARDLSMYDVYDIDTYLNAIPTVKEKYPDVRFLLAGRDEYGNYENRVKPKLRQLGCTDNFVYLGEIAHNDMPLLLSSVDVYVDPIYPPKPPGHMGHVVSLLEAMACEVPTVVANRGEIEDERPTWYHGKVFEGGNVSGLANGIIDTLEDKKDTLKRTVMNLASVREQMEWNKCMKEIEKKLEGAL